MKFDDALWGCSGPFYGDFEVWKHPDQTIGRIEFCAKNGFRCAPVDLAETEDPARKEVISSALKKNNLRSFTHFHTDFFGKPTSEALKDADAFIRRLEKETKPLGIAGVGTCVPTHYHRFLRKPSLEEQMDRLARILAPVASACHSLGMALSIENHGDYYCSDLAGLCKRVPHLGMMLDTGNTFLIGENPDLAYEAAAPYVTATHLKDISAAPNHEELKLVSQGAAFGDGNADIAGAVKTIMKGSPHPEKIVWLWEMIAPPGGNALECMGKSWKFLRSLEVWK